MPGKEVVLRFLHNLGSYRPWAPTDPGFRQTLASHRPWVLVDSGFLQTLGSCRLWVPTDPRSCRLSADPLFCTPLALAESGFLQTLGSHRPSVLQPLYSADSGFPQTLHTAAPPFCSPFILQTCLSHFTLSFLHCYILLAVACDHVLMWTFLLPGLGSS